MAPLGGRKLLSNVSPQFNFQPWSSPPPLDPEWKNHIGQNCLKVTFFDINFCLKNQNRGTRPRAWGPCGSLSRTCVRAGRAATSTDRLPKKKTKNSFFLHFLDFLKNFPRSLYGARENQELGYGLLDRAC